eukprot:1146608-Pelagomonas_calceolata.AAC.4
MRQGLSISYLQRLLCPLNFLAPAQYNGIANLVKFPHVAGKRQRKPANQGSIMEKGFLQMAAPYIQQK